MRHADPTSLETGAVPFGGPSRGVVAVMALALIVLLSPFLVTDVPAVTDYPNHLARFFVLAHPDDPILSKFYAPHWTILPNLGMDVLGQALLRILPPSVGGRLILALSMIAPLAGALIYARAAFGRWTWWSLGAAAIGYNGVFLLGFMNYQLGIGLALIGAAIWRVLRRDGRPASAAICGLFAGGVAFACHLFGFAFFALLIGSQEFEAVLALWRTPKAAIGKALRAAGPLAFAVLPPTMLYLAIRRPNTNGDEVWWDWLNKTWALFTPFAGYEEVFTKVVGVTTIVTIMVACRSARRASGVATALIALAAVFAVAPFAAGGGTFVDARLPLMGALLLFAGLAPRPTARGRRFVAASLTLITLAHAGDAALNWRGRDEDLADLRTSLTLIAPGSRLLVAGPGVVSPLPLLHGRLIPGLAPTYTHLPGLALIERKAFWPSFFADPSQQPVIVRPPYDQIAAPLKEPAFWSRLSHPTPAAEDLEAAPYLADWRNRFDDVLLLDPDAAVGPEPKGLTLLRRGTIASLYRIDR